MKHQLKKRLGDLLVDEALITDKQLTIALKEQHILDLKLGETLIRLGFISDDQLIIFLSHQLEVEIVDLNSVHINPNAVSLLPEVHARRLRAIVIDDDGNTLKLVVSDPADLDVLNNLSQLLGGRHFELLIAPEIKIIETFSRVYRRTEEIASFAEKLEGEHGTETTFDLISDSVVNTDSSDTTVVQLLNSVFADAVQVGASDIHIEPDEEVLRIRLRVDGVLQETLLPEASIANALVLRIKLMAHMDISEKRLPQDGRFQIKVKDQKIDVRVASIPIISGESVVMRLLNQSLEMLKFDEIGMPKIMQERFKLQLSRPNGLILVTGPTGSGKTTTLYSALNLLNKSDVKILTVEDPVEYRLPRINQVQVNKKIGLDFSTVLRSTLRQDPDVLLVGEMRDKETMEIAMRGALTGHLVLSTLHTNNPISTTLRLLDMGAAGYLIGSVLRMVLAQRLVRKLCVHCKEQRLASEDQQLLLKQLLVEDFSKQMFSFPRGCHNCNSTGYKSRVGVYELLELNRDMVSALRNDDSEGFAQAALHSKDFKPVSVSAFELAQEGITSLDEVMKLVDRFEVLHTREKNK